MCELKLQQLLSEIMIFEEEVRIQESESLSLGIQTPTNCGHRTDDGAGGKRVLPTARCANERLGF
jgi:hypothetical protein